MPVVESECERLERDIRLPISQPSTRTIKAYKLSAITFVYNRKLGSIRMLFSTTLAVLAFGASLVSAECTVEQRLASSNQVAIGKSQRPERPLLACVY